MPDFQYIHRILDTRASGVDKTEKTKQYTMLKGSENGILFVAPGCEAINRKEGGDDDAGPCNHMLYLTKDLGRSSTVILYSG